MFEKYILIYLAHFILAENVRAQSVEIRDTQTNNPAIDLVTGNFGPNTISINSAQAIGNVDPMGLPNVLPNGPATPEAIVATLANQGVPEDLMRSARGALIGGFGSPIPAIESWNGNQVPAGYITGGLTGIPDGIILGAAMGTPLPSGLGGPIDVIATVSEPIREFIPTNTIPERPPPLEMVRVPINPEIGTLPPVPIADSIFDAAVATNTAMYPITSAGMPSNPINAISGPVTAPVLRESNNVGVTNRLVNPVPMGPNLPNPASIPGMVNKTPTLAGPAVANGLAPQGMFTNNLPSSFPTNLAASKSLLASITGIDPANLGTRSRFRVKSASPLPPTGLTIQAENLLMEGKLAVTGKLPFLGAVTVDGVLPDGGIGTVSYECGNGNIGIVNEVPGGTMTPVNAGFGDGINYMGVISNVF